jgi:hypothetical protein
MNRLVLSLAGATFLAVASIGAAAQDAKQDITIKADVKAFCTKGSTSGTTQNIAITDGNPGLSDGKTKINVTCNGNSTIAFSSKNGAVTLGNVAAGSAPIVSNFASFFTYTATATGGDAPVSFTTTGGSAPETQAATTLKSSAFVGDIEVAVVANDPVEPLLAGLYEDTLTVTIAPGT